MAMTLWVSVLFLIMSYPSTIFSSDGLRGPPHVTSDMVPTYRSKLGDTVKIDCPIDSGPSLQVYYEWKKDGETITSAWDRFRVTPKKLRIKGVLGEDGGTYECKGTNGFGSKQLSTTLIVEDENGEVIGGGGGGEGAKKEESEDPTNTNKFLPDEILGIRRPSFIEITAPPSGASTFRTKVGSSLTLKCQVDGHPLPTVSWFRIRDKVQLPRANGEQVELTGLTYEDSGIYVCVASNAYGQINASFIVEIIESGMEGPSIISLESSNVTAVKGQLIHFRCLISSDTLPNVQWLRQLGDEELDSNGGLQMAGVRYRVIGSGSRITAFQNGTYISELSLPMEGRAAGIVCLATNSGGFKFETTMVKIQNGNLRDGDPVLPMTILIVIPVTLLFLFSSIAIIFCCFRKAQGRGRNLATVTTTTMYATPRDATSNEYQAPPLPFYNPRQHPYQQHFSSQHRTMGSAGSPGCPVTHFGSQQYYCNSSKESGSPIKTGHHLQYHSSPAAPAYASVPICELPGTGSTSTSGMSRGPPLPSRTFPNPNQSLRGGDRNNYNTQGLLTQPLLTQTGSSSDSRDSRHSGGGGGCGVVGHRGGIEFGSNLTHSQGRQQQMVVDHWCSDGSEGSWDRKNSKTHHQIRV